MLRVLVVGSGGREHTLCWKLKQSPLVSDVFCAPGNGGIAEIATCVNIPVGDFTQLVQLVEKEQIDYTVVGPEQPLQDGIVDFFEARGLAVFGPNRRAAQVEGSKAFAKQLMERYNIPTAAYRPFSNYEAARDYVRRVGVPIVIKADGLAAGKGVTVAETIQEAEEALAHMMRDRVFGQAGEEVVIEECLHGEELSLMAFVSRHTVLPMAASQDHKPVFDGDAGPNTGGMGAYSPVPHIPADIVSQAVRDILQPMADGMEKEGLDFRGVLYAGLMITEHGPKVIEFNARFGDPETQVVLPRMNNDLLNVLQATSQGNLDQVALNWDERAALCVVLTSGGYPGTYKTGLPISEKSITASDTISFHAGTRRLGNQLLTNGGRVLGVTALGNDLHDARQKAYQAVDNIQFPNRHYRRDIGERAFKNVVQ